MISLLLTAVLLGNLGTLAGPATQPSEAAQRDDQVLASAASYTDGGGYVWRDTGVPNDLTHDGETVIERSETGTFCCGFTLAVAWEVGQDRGLFDDATAAQMKRFQREWYGVEAGAGDPLMSTAMQTLGVGGAVAPGDARPGDFLQLWRKNGSGHSVVFLGWLVENGERVGVRYRSSQTATDGIGDHAERLAAHGGKVTTLHFARLNPAADAAG